MCILKFKDCLEKHDCDKCFYKQLPNGCAGCGIGVWTCKWTPKKGEEGGERFVYPE